MKATPESQVRIQIRCPQCGGDIDFLEEAHVIRCAFCGSLLLVAGREGVLRYVLPTHLPDAPAACAKALESMRIKGRISPRVGQAFFFYAPFWRLRGTVYRWIFGLSPLKVEIETGVSPPMERMKVLLIRVMDHTIAGYKNLEIGLATLGVRTQALLLHPFSREHLEKRESFLPLDVSLEQAQAEAGRFADFFFQAENLTPEVILHHLGEKEFSVVYFPIWYVEGEDSSGKEALLIDGVGKSLLPAHPDWSSISQKLKEEKTRKSFNFSEIRFLPFRCPNCGWAFSFRPLSVLHFCSTCRRLWREKGGEWTEVAHRAILPPQRLLSERLVWIPFWRCRATIKSSGDSLTTMADLYRIAPPLRVINQLQEARRPIYFYFPGVKFRNPQVFPTLASRLTFLQPEVSPSSFPEGFHPFTAGGSLSEAEALEMGPVILGSLIPPKNRQARAWLKDCLVELREPQLLYFPFAQVDLFLKELSTGLSFQRRVLSEDL